jgi:hypothetical protein
MEFALKYSGTLKSNAGPDEKHRIRQVFHEQMKELWNHESLNSHHELVDLLVRSVGCSRFVPLVTAGLAFTAEVDVSALDIAVPEEAA